MVAKFDRFHSDQQAELYNAENFLQNLDKNLEYKNVNKNSVTNNIANSDRWAQKIDFVNHSQKKTFSSKDHEKT